MIERMKRFPPRPGAALVVLAGTLGMLAAPAGAQTLSNEREFWTADQLHDDFLADFGQDTDACYSDYRLVDGPEPPDGPATAGSRWTRAIVAIDASGSMAGRVGGQVKMEAAKDAVREFLESVPEEAEVGLLAFGHLGDNDESGKAVSCEGIELLAEPGRMDIAGITGALDSFEATGWTPLGAAIAKAGESFEPSETEGDQVVFVVSDGVETCGGDPAAAARALRESDVRAVVNIIGFDIPARDRQELARVAEAGGGNFTEAANAEELRERLRLRNENVRDLTTFRNASVQATTSNRNAVVRAKTEAANCVVQATTDESNTFLRLSQDLVASGRTDGENAREVRERLRVRHDQKRERLDAFRATADADLEAVNGPIDEELERVRALYD